MEELPRNLQSELVSLGQMVDLEIGQILIDRDGDTDYIYFPFAGYISLVASVDQHAAMEIALIGNEGVAGVTLLSGVSTAALLAVVQGPGVALKITELKFQKKCETNSTLRMLVKKSISGLLAQLVNTSTCAKFHELRPRLAKRLLEVHDRTGTDSFHATHQVLADLLGVRRSAVSIAANFLQQQNCIRYSRGNITILNRQVLEVASCSCYEPIAAYPKNYVRYSTDQNLANNYIAH